MRRLLLASITALSSIGLVQIASAADLPRKAPVAVPVAYNWTGFYIGANVGGGWGNRSVDYTANDPNAAALFLPGIGGAPPSTSFTSSGALGGLQLGYNWQFNRNWLIGAETDFDWSGIKGSGSSSGMIVGIDPFTATVNERVKWFGTVRARLGYLPMDNFLTYITGGFAYGRVEHTGSYVSTGGPITFGAISGFSFVCPGGGATCFTGSSSSVATGWTAGTGFEYAFAQNWTFKGEYLYVSLGSKSLTETALVLAIAGTNPASFNANYSRTTFNVARLGVNYRF